MSIDALLGRVSQYYQDKLTADNAYLNQEISELFKINFSPTEEDWAHFYGSLASNQTICVFQSLNCSIPNEKGWNTEYALKLYFRVLIEVYARNQFNLELAEKLENLIKHLYQTISLITHRKNKSTNTHLAKLMRSIDNLYPGDILCYQGGYQGHSVYFNVVPHNRGGFRVYINNLGSGRNHHEQDEINDSSKRCLVYQRSIYFNDIDDLEKYLYGLIKAKKQQNSTYAFDKIYLEKYTEKQKQYDRRLLAEICQTTGNCAVKNFLLATQQILKDEECYKNIFKQSVNVVLSNYRAFGNEHLMPSKPDICSSLMLTQLSFAADNCPTITDDIVLFGKSSKSIQSPPSTDSGTLAPTLGALGGFLLSMLAVKMTAKEPKANHYIAAGLAGAGIGFFAGKSTQTSSGQTVIPQSARNESIYLPTTNSHCYSCSNKL